MKEGIKLLAEMVNGLHDLLITLSNDILGMGLTDKDLHFWIMGIIGIGAFFLIFAITKWLSKFPYGVTVISFLYTLTFMLVLVFAIEIQQAITNRGNMEFVDAVIGLWGYLVMFMVYAGLGFIFIAGKALYRKYTASNKNDIKT